MFFWESLSEKAQGEFKQWLWSQDGKPSKGEMTTWLEERGLPTDMPDADEQVGSLMHRITTEKLLSRCKAYSAGPLKVPGFGLSLGWLPDKDRRFPTLLGSPVDDAWAAATLLVREVCMLRLMEELTNKPSWWTKVRDPGVAAKWKKEALEVDWASVVDHADFTPAMADACLAELRVKADLYEETGFIPVMDYSACAIKSDRLIPAELFAALSEAVALLEDVPADRKDWHPGTDQKVLDLVHPSLWPLVYGRSRILTEKRIGLKDCLEHCGMGETTEKPLYVESGDQALSATFQWLPCDVAIDADGRARIDSYINNLHPVEHAALYPIIEQFIQKSLPVWDIVYRWPAEFQMQRLKVDAASFDCLAGELCDEGSDIFECQRTSRPVNEGEPPREEYEHDEDWYDGSERAKLDAAWFKQNHPMKLPEPKPDDVSHLEFNASDIRTSGFFDEAQRVQVIVKLANIHLTPDKPSYDGGSWHVEGQLNEHICATALFYYDGDNITDCHLGMRTTANAEDLETELEHAQYDYYSIERTFAIDAEHSTLQNLGSVLTRTGRALFFPNLYQHRVSPFRLADPTRPGHRKILALFLVDPAIPIVSTANVPPQQKHWWREETGLASASGLAKLPQELTEMVLGNLDFPFDEDEAKELRTELMAERTVVYDTQESWFADWNFCEH